MAILMEIGQLADVPAREWRGRPLLGRGGVDLALRTEEGLGRSQSNCVRVINGNYGIDDVEEDIYFLLVRNDDLGALGKMVKIGKVIGDASTLPPFTVRWREEVSESCRLAVDVPVCGVQGGRRGRQDD